MSFQNALRRYWVFTKSGIRHAIRSRLVIVLFVFTLVMQLVLIKLFRTTVIQIQGQVTSPTASNLLFGSILVQAMSAFLISVVYGLWMVPYAHRGSRSALTHVLPIARTGMVFSYGTVLAILLALQFFITLICVGVSTGFSFFLSPDFSTYKTGLVFVLEVVALQMVSALLALGALSFGQVVTFVLASLLFVLLQVASGLFRLEIVQMIGSTWDGFERVQKIYDWMPPVGEFLYQIKDVFGESSLSGYQWTVWMGWWAIAQALLILRIKFPSVNRNEE